jgi:hypothetical protein
VEVADKTLGGQLLLWKCCCSLCQELQQGTFSCPPLSPRTITNLYYGTEDNLQTATNPDEEEDNIDPMGPIYKYNINLRINKGLPNTTFLINLCAPMRYITDGYIWKFCNTDHSA